MNAAGKVKVDIIVPSRNQDSQAEFLRQALISIEGQLGLPDMIIRVIICCDPGWKRQAIPDGSTVDVVVVEAGEPSQAAALNAGLNLVDGDFVAVLEDDDVWHPHFLQTAMSAYQQVASNGGRSALISSNQLEVNVLGEIERVNDFATPSGWFMGIDTLAQVGLFNTGYRFHLDNEWLGRAAIKRIQRIHLVEASAPAKIEHMAQVRPWLFNVINNSDGTCRLGRHDLFIPLVKRLVHENSGMARIKRNPELTNISNQECKLLRETYGRIPW